MNNDYLNGIGGPVSGSIEAAPGKVAEDTKAPAAGAVEKPMRRARNAGAKGRDPAND